MTDRGPGDAAIVRRLLGLARPYWPHVAGIVVLGLLASPLALLAPLPLKIAVDSALGDEPLPAFLDALVPASLTGAEGGMLLLAVGLVVVIALLTQLQSLGSSWLRTYTGEKLILEFRSRLFAHVQRLSFAYTDTAGSSDTTYRIQYDAPSIRSVALESVIPFATSAVTVLAMLYVAMRIDWALALVALAICPALFVIFRVYRRRLRQQARQVKRLESGAMSVVQEVLTAIRIVKAFGQERREQQRFVGRSHDGVRARLRLVLAEGAFGTMVAVVTAAGTAGVLFMGIRHVQAGVISLGDLLLVLGYIAQLYAPLKTMSRKAARLQSHLAGAERAFALLDEPRDVEEKPDARPLRRAAGAVTFSDVGFAYLAGQPVLENVSFDVPAGTRVALTGATGAGKTTLISLLTRFYDPTSGCILLDGTDLRDYRLADLRSQFAIVLQEPLLFSTTIGENIAYARPDAHFDEIVSAAVAAGAHGFIEQLAEGYDTQVGERGMRLSGGERQRIALARAFLKDAPLLILDEPTSSVDARTEAGIMEAMERLMRNRTTFLISHRPSTLEICDAHVEIEHGRVASVSDGLARTGATLSGVAR